MLYFKVAKRANPENSPYKEKNIFVSFFSYLYEKMDLKKTYNHFIICVSLVIALYTLNLYGAVGQ